MALVRVVRGQQVHADVYFFSAAGEPAVGSGPCVWSVRDYKGNLIVGGNATQDPLNSARWTATFTLPLDAPLAMITGDRYQIIWSMPLANGGTQVISERFEVLPEGDLIRPVNKTDRIMMGGGVFTDTLFLPEPPQPGSLRIRVVDVNDNVLFDGDQLPTDPPSRYVSDGVAYDATSENPVPAIVADYGASGFSPLVSIWEYTPQNGIPSLETHMVYVLNTKAVLLMNSVKKTIDRANLGSIDPEMAFADTDFIHYILRAIEQLNAAGPQVTYFTIPSLPANFVDITVKIASVMALRAQYLDEGWRTFNFSDMGVSQLSVDRTMYLESLANALEGQIDGPGGLKDQKTLYAKNGGADGGYVGGHLAVTIGALTSWSLPIGPYYMGIRGYAYRGIPSHLSLISVGVAV